MTLPRVSDLKCIYLLFFFSIWQMSALYSLLNRIQGVGDEWVIPDTTIDRGSCVKELQSATRWRQRINCGHGVSCGGLWKLAVDSCHR